MVTPLTATPLWLSSYLLNKRDGADELASRTMADKACGISPKGFARLALKGMVLSVPLAGGASILKKRDCRPVLSDHGKWRKEHLGAFSAIYGRTPYYDHLIPEIEEVYAASQEMELETFNSGLLDVALRWLDADDPPLLIDEKSPLLQEIASKINPDISIFDALFRLGKITRIGLHLKSPIQH